MHRRSPRYVLLHAISDVLRRGTGREGRAIHPQRFGSPLERCRIERLLISKHCVMHLPKLARAERALASLSRTEREGMKPNDWVMTKGQQDLPGVDVTASKLGQRLPGKLGAKRALKIGVLDQGNTGLSIAEQGRALATRAPSARPPFSATGPWASSHRSQSHMPR